ncbi:hypothetical protein pdam_00018467 [Pocillopora damicornis]|uniref:Uncharacterized protein n=1 Tax=Pocillopora damicornis TaxID=46731 RepID=A0A3M6UDY8_POCDA|nr:hypothetical protein pdam_00018467 [Pocillopora damicornis]
MTSQADSSSSIISKTQTQEQIFTSSSAEAELASFITLSGKKSSTSALVYPLPARKRKHGKPVTSISMALQAAERKYSQIERQFFCPGPWYGA